MTNRSASSLSAIGQTRPAIIEIKGLKTSHFKESKTAPWDRGEIGSMGHVQCPQSESANNDLQPGRSRMVAATDCERAGDQSRDSRPVFALGKTSHFDCRHYGWASELLEDVWGTGQMSLFSATGIKPEWLEEATTLLRGTGCPKCHSPQRKAFISQGL